VAVVGLFVLGVLAWPLALLGLIVERLIERGLPPDGFDLWSLFFWWFYYDLVQMAVWTGAFLVLEGVLAAFLAGRPGSERAGGAGWLALLAGLLGFAGLWAFASLVAQPEAPDEAVKFFSVFFFVAGALSSLGYWTVRSLASIVAGIRSGPSGSSERPSDAQPHRFWDGTRWLSG
jgi:hypothetical protein